MASPLALGVVAAMMFVRQVEVLTGVFRYERYWQEEISDRVALIVREGKRDGVAFKGVEEQCS